jgi:hypothetical protein
MLHCKPHPGGDFILALIQDTKPRPNGVIDKGAEFCTRQRLQIKEDRGGIADAAWIWLWSPARLASTAVRLLDGIHTSLAAKAAERQVFKIELSQVVGLSR